MNDTANGPLTSQLNFGIKFIWILSKSSKSDGNENVAMANPVIENEVTNTNDDKVCLKLFQSRLKTFLRGLILNRESNILTLDLVLVWIILCPCQHDNGYIDGRSQI